MQENIERTVAQLVAEFNKVATAPQLYAAGRANGMTCKQVKETFIVDSLRVDRGKYDVTRLNLTNLPVFMPTDKTTSIPKPEVEVFKNRTVVASSQKTFEDLEEVYVPQTDPTFVPWGDFKTVKTVIDSRMFFPIYISGLSGNGKTMMVEQACAKSKREFVRVQISPETDESDLLGSFRLVDGETVFYKGPVIKAMERGAVLLIDELDRGTNKIMCLQGVLEGKPVLLKKIGQVIVPAPGFNVIATANTKGNGSEDGRFSAASIIDEAFLERFVATIEQPYPTINTEKSIIQKHMTSLGFMDEEFADRLVAWSDIIRKTFQEGGMDDLISTRRLCHIVKSYSIFKNRSTAIAMCIARFAPDTASAFLDLYTKIDASVNPEPVAKPDDLQLEAEEVPF